MKPPVGKKAAWKGSDAFFATVWRKLKERRFEVKRFLIGGCVLVALFVVVLAAFVTGLEFGYRMGYDYGWRECKYDAKSTSYLTHDDNFLKWYGSTNSVIRQRRSLCGTMWPDPIVE